MKRLKVPPPVNQFKDAVDKPTGEQFLEVNCTIILVVQLRRGGKLEFTGQFIILKDKQKFNNFLPYNT